MSETGQMTDAQHQWAEVNLFHCTRLKADLSPEACEANRGKPIIGKNRTKEEYDSVPHGRKGQYRPISCEKCTDWERLCREVYEKRVFAGKKENRPAPVEAPASSEWVCARCKTVCSARAARGLGWKCYTYLKNHGGLENYPRSVKYPEKRKPRKGDAGKGPAAGGLRRTVKNDAGQKLVARIDHFAARKAAVKTLADKMAEAIDEFLAAHPATGG